MSFDLNGLNTTSSGGRRGSNGAIRDYAYRTSDTLSDVRGANYFDEIKNRLSVGDQINVRSDTDNISEVYVISQTSPTVVLGQKYPGTNFKEEISIRLPNVSQINESSYHTSFLGRKIVRITAITEDGTTITNPTEIEVFINGTPIVHAPIIFPVNTFPGTSISVLATDDNITTAGVLNQIQTRPIGVSTTTAPVRVNIILEMQIVLDS